MKSKKTLDSFVKYCKSNPEQRFWQALCNWSNYKFIYGRKKESNMADVFPNDSLEDTFYKEER